MKFCTTILVKNTFVFLAILVLFFLVGGMLRLYHLDVQSYWMDEGYTVNAVMSIVETGAPTLDSGMAYFCPVYCYPTALLVQKLGDNPTSYRLFSAIAGLLFIVVMYLVTSRFFERHIALLASFFITFSYWQIAWSRQARWYTLFSVFFWLALLFFYQTLYGRNKRVLWLALTVLTSTFAILTHSIGYLLPFIFLGWIAYDHVFLKKKFEWKTALFIGTLGVVAMFMLDTLLGVNFIAPLVAHVRFYYELPYYLSFYLRTYWLFIPFVLIAIFGYKTEYTKSVHFLLFTLFAYLLPLSFLTNIVHYRYLFHVTPVIFLLAAVGIIGTQEHFKRTYQKIIFSAALLALFFTVGGGVLVPQTAYYLESDNPETLGSRPHYAYTPQPDWKSAYEFIRTQRQSGDIIISSHPHFNKIFLREAGYWIKYDYLGISQNPSTIRDDREYYVGAKVIDDLDEFIAVTDHTHGYVIFDYMAADGRLPTDIVSYIEQHFTLAYHEKTNAYSEVWVYKF